jgi:hypothetical protein
MAKIKNVGIKLLWIGLTLVVAIPVVLKTLDLGGSTACIIVGAAVMTLGCILNWFDNDK